MNLKCILEIFKLYTKNEFIHIKYSVFEILIPGFYVFNLNLFYLINININD